jgi:hypothetical protein
VRGIFQDGGVAFSVKKQVELILSNLIGFNYHFLYLSPGMSGDWFFIAAKAYWLHFQPNVISNLTIATFTPSRRHVAITSLSRRDTAPMVRTQIAKLLPNAYHDPLVYDYLNEMQLTLDKRTALDQRFGVPDAVVGS